MEFACQMILPQAHWNLLQLMSQDLTFRLLPFLLQLFTFWIHKSVNIFSNLGYFQLAFPKSIAALLDILSLANYNCKECMNDVIPFEVSSGNHLIPYIFHIYSMAWIIHLFFSIVVKPYIAVITIIIVITLPFITSIITVKPKQHGLKTYHHDENNRNI